MHEAPGSQSQLIYGAVKRVLEETSLDLNALDCIAFDCGPGNFTGLRVGAAVAQSLSFGLSVPVCRISSLAAMAAGTVRRHQVSAVASCLDARMGEAYLALYQVEDQQSMIAEIEDELVDPTAFSIAGGQKFFAAGPGWSTHVALFERHRDLVTGSDFQVLPSAEDLLSMAEISFRAGQTVSAAEAVPNYLRDKVTQ
jgi:tRNA threonylcarbamoyladenosine biosynthesis protein TsaB